MSVDHVAALAARLRSDQVRSTWLLAIAEGVVSVDDVVIHAGEIAGKPLRPLRLHQLLSAQHGWGATRTNSVLVRMGVILGQPVDRRRASVAWLLDGRSPARFDAWLMARKGPAPPWPGFPYTPAPRPGR